jgi:putative aldouronate transport system substrate-binding protein
MKRTLLTVVVLVLAVSVSSVWATGTQEAGTESEGVVMSGEGPSWTWDTSDWETSWYFSMTYATWGKFYDPQLNIVSKTIYEDTGLKDIEFTVAENNDNQRLTAMIVARDLPAIVTCTPWTQPHFSQLQDERLVYDLFELSDKYNAELKDQMLETPSVTNWNTSDDGHHYYLNAKNWPSELLDTPLGRRAQAWRGVDPNMVANQGWMEEIGLSPDDFTTLDDVYEALSEFAEAGITYNGKSVWPLNPGTNFGEADAMRYAAQLIGFTFEGEDGNYRDYYTSPEFLEMSKFMNKAYRAGFIPEEQFVWETDQVQQNIANGRYFMTIGNVGGSHNYYRQLFADSNETMKYNSVGPLHSSSGNEAALASSDLRGSPCTFITKNAKDPARVIRFFSYMHHPDQQFLVYHGVEGETFEWTSDGKYVDQYEELDELEVNVSEYIKQTGLKHIFYTHRNAIYRHGYRIPPEDEADVMVRSWSDFYRPYVYTADALRYIHPPAGSDEADIESAIEIYMNEQVPKMILADSEAELVAIYDESVATIEDMGLAQFNEWCNGELQRRKDRLGVDFVTPRFQ